MSEPPASSDFVSRTNNINARQRLLPVTSSSSSHRRADPPSDPPDSRRLPLSSNPNARRSTGSSSRGLSTPNARVTGTTTNVIPSPTSVRRPTIEPPTISPSSLTGNTSISAASVSSALPTFKGQVSGGSILKIEGKKVITSPPLLSDQVKKAMEEARQQQKRENNESALASPTIPSASMLTDKVSNRKATKNLPSKKVPITEQQPPPPQLGSSGSNKSKDLNTGRKGYNVDDTKSITLMESPPPVTPKEEVKAVPPVQNSNGEPAPKIPSFYQKKKAIVANNHNNDPATTTRSSRKLEETWEFDTNTRSNSSCCIIS